jgi:hypothetical protein
MRVDVASRTADSHLLPLPNGKCPKSIPIFSGALTNNGLCYNCIAKYFDAGSWKRVTANTEPCSQDVTFTTRNIYKNCGPLKTNTKKIKEIFKGKSILGCFSLQRFRAINCTSTQHKYAETRIYVRPQAHA